GCTGNCSFCTTWHVRPSFMAYGMETLEKHLQFYKKKGVKTIIIMDDSFLNPLKLPGVPSEDAIKHILAVMRKINSQGFKVEFGNGLELRLLWKYWKELHRALFRNCFRLYMPLEDLAYSEKEKPAFEKLMAFEKETDLMRKIIAMRKKGFPLRQLTFGIIVGKPSDSEEGLKRTIERAKIVKETFRGSEIEIALTPYLNSLLPGTIDFAKYNEKLSLKDINRDPELLCYSMVSNRTEHIKDTKKVWGAWLAIMNLNPAKNYLENFRKNGEVILAKVEK
ncbi:MAG: radical SAM protein, partial [Candidatus Diapherotrites archaeon]|nr:radical SAM protein [Candidatus Diapherotrites archaeon]